MAYRVLVIDDEPDLELLIVQRFSAEIESGELVFEFAINGLEGLKKIEKQNNFEVILTDLKMPVMDGLELLSILKEKEILSKAIVASAYDDIENIRSAMNSGAFDFIVKPISFDDLKVTIYKAISEYKGMMQGLDARIKLIEAVKEKESAILKERLRISRDLHDDIGACRRPGACHPRPAWRQGNSQSRARPCPRRPQRAGDRRSRRHGDCSSRRQSTHRVASRGRSPRRLRDRRPETPGRSRRRSAPQRRAGAPRAQRPARRRGHSSGAWRIASHATGHAMQCLALRPARARARQKQPSTGWRPRLAARIAPARATRLATPSRRHRRAVPKVPKRPLGGPRAQRAWGPHAKASSTLSTIRKLTRSLLSAETPAMCGVSNRFGHSLK